MAFMMTAVAVLVKKMDKQGHKDRILTSYHPVARQGDYTEKIVICIRLLKMWREMNATPIAPCAKHCLKLSLGV
jgi:hypothetical protein